MTGTVLYMDKNMLIITTDFLYDHFAFLIHVSRLQKRYRYLKIHKTITDGILILYYKETTYIILFRTKKLHCLLFESLFGYDELFSDKQVKPHTKFTSYSQVSQQHLKIITQGAANEVMQEFEK